MAPNILGFPVLELLPDAVFEHDKKSPESYIKKKTQNFFFPNTVLFPTLSYKLFSRLNSEYLLTISEPADTEADRVSTYLVVKKAH